MVALRVIYNLLIVRTVYNMAIMKLSCGSVNQHYVVGYIVKSVAVIRVGAVVVLRRLGHGHFRTVLVVLSSSPVHSHHLGPAALPLPPPSLTTLDGT